MQRFLQFFGQNDILCMAQMAPLVIYQQLLLYRLYLKYVGSVLICIFFLFFGCSLVVLWLFFGCSLVVLWLFFGCSLVVLWLFFGCSLVVLWLFFGCSLVVLLLF